MIAMPANLYYFGSIDMNIRGNRKKLIIIAALCVVIIAAATAALVFLRPLKVSFDPGCVPANGAPGAQTVKRGECVRQPAVPVREGYIFLGWYTADMQSRPYDFKSPVKRSFTLTGKWADLSDTRDTDGDGLIDAIELAIGTDVNNADTDGDGLPDHTEYIVLGLDPLSVDTDRNGVKDGDEDSDGDGLLNAEEVAANTSPLLKDTDGDGLTDLEECREHKTSPTDRDTDGDGADDLTEISIGSDPLKAEERFVTSVSTSPVSEKNAVSLTVSAETDSAGAGTMTVTPLASTNIPALSEAAYGYIGNAFEVYSDGVLSAATLSFSYDPSCGTPGEDFQPCVYYYDETENELVELQTQIDGPGKVTARTDHFSIYTILNKVEVDAANALATAFGYDQLADSNNDGIPDCYAEQMNDGKLLYDNSPILVGVLDMFGDDDDWDDDGIKNGDEIEVVVSVLTGRPKIVIYSNPVLKDSDFDDLSDYVEACQIGTDPLRYDRRSLGALNQLQNDGQYLYMTYERKLEDNVALLFDYNRYEEAKDCLINYFSDYAPEDTIVKNAERIARQRSREDALEVYGLVSNLVTIAKDLSSIVDTGTKNADLERQYYETIEIKKNIITDINVREAGMDSLGRQLKLLTLPDDLQKYVDGIRSGDISMQFEGLTKLCDTADKALKAYHAACYYHVCAFASELRGMEQLSNQAGSYSVFRFDADSFTVACDIIETGGNVLEVYTTYGKLAANADAYNAYIELLMYIRDNASDKNVGNAARDIAKIIMDNSGLEFFLQLSDACGKEFELGALKVALDICLGSNPYYAVAKMLIAVYQKIGITDLSKYNMYFSVMQEISKGSNAMLRRAIKKEDQTFSYKAENEAWVEKYLVQLAQSRVMGEFYYHEYCASDSWAASLANMASGKGPDEYRKMFRTEAEQIYGYANRLQLKLSKALPYYNQFWSDSVPEDGLEISTEIDPLQARRYRNAFKAYLELLEQKRSAINKINEVCPPVYVCDVCGDATPELIYKIQSRVDYGFPINDLYILTYENGQIRELYSVLYLDSPVAGGGPYYFFQMNGEKPLYVYTSVGDSYSRITYSVLETNASGKLEGRELLQEYHSFDVGAGGNMIDIDRYTKEGKSISAEEYKQAQLDIQSHITNILIYRQDCDFAKSFVGRNGNNGMTCDEAIAYLQKLLGTSR